MTKPLLLAATWLLTACTTPHGVAPAVSDRAAAAPADRFYQSIATLCGQSFAGKIVANTPASATPDSFAGKALVMHVRECSDDELRVPFHVGDDRSRTWILTRRAGGLRLKHDHRHADGSPDATTLYGGDTDTAGSQWRQEFPVDAESVAMFQRQGMHASLTNIWAMEIRPGSEFV